MTRTPQRLSPAGLAFLTERHLSSYTSLRPDGGPHVTAVGFTWDAETGVALVITSGTSRKARHAGAGAGPVVLCQVDGPRWLSLEGTARLSDDPGQVAHAVARYTARYRPPRHNPGRVVIHIAVHSAYGSRELFMPCTD